MPDTRLEIVRLCQEHSVLRRSSFLAGEAGARGLPDAWWFRPDGRTITRRATACR